MSRYKVNNKSQSALTMIEHSTAPYLLLTPGPLSTTLSVKQKMLRDWCTWDRDYNDIVQDIRARLVSMASAGSSYTAVLMQGSGTFSVEACIGSMLPADGKLLVLANGAYGQRIAEIAGYLNIAVVLEDFDEVDVVDPDRVTEILESDPSITHVAVVHVETTTGMLNPVAEIGRRVKAQKRIYMIDAMSSFGGMDMDMDALSADFLISSANKCIQGVPGFGFIIARQSQMARLEGNARSLSLDMYAQWKTMEIGAGKWRFTSPTHVVRAFMQALVELEAEGGPVAREARYQENNDRLVAGMCALGFKPLLGDALRSIIITSFISPDHEAYQFEAFYQRLKAKGFVIYPGKITVANTLRIGNIGDIQPADIDNLLVAVAESMYWA